MFYFVDLTTILDSCNPFLKFLRPSHTMQTMNIYNVALPLKAGYLNDQR